MYLLIRKCSFYTENDIVLGCFTSMELALSAKQLYIAHIRDPNNGDPHSKQGYFSVNLENNVTAIPLGYNQSIDNCTTVYLLYEESEGFGQIFRELKHANSSLEETIKIASALAIPMDTDGFPTHLVYTELVIDSLRFENKDHSLYLNVNGGVLDDNIVNMH